MYFRRSVIAFGLVAALVGSSGCSHPSPEKRAEWIVSKISDKLDLNSEQKGRLENVKAAMLERHQSHAADRAKHVADLKQLILAEKLDVVRAKSLMKEHQKGMEGDFDAVVGKIADFHASLRPEQRQKAADLLDKLAEHFQ